MAIELRVIPVLIGVLLAVGVAGLGRVTRFDEDRSFYSTILIIIASYYLLFAIMGHSMEALIRETIVAVVFSAVAVFGALRLPLVIGIGIVAHGLFDFIHHALIPNPGVPAWWPAFCLSIDVVLGLWVIGLYQSRRTHTVAGVPHRL